MSWIARSKGEQCAGKAEDEARITITSEPRVTTPGYSIPDVSRVHYLYISGKPPMALPRNAFLAERDQTLRLCYNSTLCSVCPRRFTTDSASDCIILCCSMVNMWRNLQESLSWILDTCYEPNKIQEDFGPLIRWKIR